MLELALRDMSWQPPGNTKKQHTKTFKLNLTLNAAQATLHMHSNTARFHTYLFTQQSTYLSNLDVHSDGLLSSQEIVKLCIIATLSTEWATKRNTWCCSTVSQNHSEVAPNSPEHLPWNLSQLDPAQKDRQDDAILVDHASSNTIIYHLLITKPFNIKMCPSDTTCK